MDPEVTVRPKGAQDASAIVGVSEALPQWFNAEGRAAIARDSTVQEGFVAEVGDTVVGFALLAPQPAGSAQLNTAELTWMGVSSPWQRRGVGSALLREAKNALSARGVRRLEVSTVADSDPYEPYARTRAFYRACGFKDFRVDRGFYGDASARYDRLTLALEW